MNSFRKGMILSVLGHASLIYLLAFSPLASMDKGSLDGDGVSDEKQGDIVPTGEVGEEFEQREIEVYLIQRKPKQEESAIEECKGANWYGGIGITHNSINKAVDSVAPGYPAFKAGVIVGDKIMSNTNSIRGEVGTQLDLIVERNGEVLIFNMVRAKICVEETP